MIFNLTHTLHWTFLLLVFFIPLEILELGPATRGTLTIPRLLGMALLGLALLSARRAFKWFPLPGYLFLGYFLVFLLKSLYLTGGVREEAISLFITLLQLFALYWIGVNLFYKNGEFLRKSLLAYGLGCFSLAMCGLLNIGGMAEISTERGLERLALKGLNPNYLACMLAMSVAILVGLCVSSNSKKLSYKIFLILLAIPQVLMMLSSGSRGGLLALILGLSLYAAPTGLSKKKLIAMIGGAIVICAIGVVALQSPVVTERIGTTMRKGHKESRHVIYNEAWLLIQERPVFGWGPKEGEVQLGRSLGGYRMNPHNVFFQVLLQTGFVGGSFVIIAVGLCFYSAWSGRNGGLNLIPLAVMTIWVVVNFAHDFFPRKATWFAFAIASSSLTFTSSNGPRTFRSRLRPKGILVKGRRTLPRG